MSYINEDELGHLAPHDFLPINDVGDESKNRKKVIRLKKKRFKRKRKSSKNISEEKIIDLKKIAKQNIITNYERKQFLSFQHSLKIPNEIIAPRPFFIHSTKQGMPGFHQKPLIKNYGRIQMTIDGRKLITLDEDVFLALSRLAKMHKNVVFITTVNEIIRIMHKCVARDTQRAVRKSLKRLYGCEIGITEKVHADGNLEEKCYDFRIIQEYALETREEGKIKVLISMNDFFRKIFSDEHNTYIDTKLRAGLKGDIAKALYMFFERNRRQGKPYRIGLYKLCDYMNLEVEGVLPCRVRKKIEDGLKVLESIKYLSDYKLGKDNNVVVWYEKIQKKKEADVDNKPIASTSSKTKEGINSNELAKPLINILDTPMTEGRREKLDEGIKTIVEFQKCIPEKTLDVPKIYRDFGTPERICKCYAEWLSEQNWVDSLHVGFCNANGKMWKRFIEEYTEDYYGYRLE